VRLQFGRRPDELHASAKMDSGEKGN
jgi:hypothetical protein